MSKPRQKALKVRIYPDKEQEVLILKTLGCCRFLYNQMLAERISVYESLREDKGSLYGHRYRTEKEYKAEYEWLKEVDSVSLQQSRIDLAAAYQNFFKSCTKKSKHKIGFPKFRKRGTKDSYRTVITGNNIAIDFVTRKLKLPKLGWIKFRDKRPFMHGTLKQATVRRTSSGKYFVSLLFTQEEHSQEQLKLHAGLKAKGLDMSLSLFYVDDCGNSPNYKPISRNALSRAQRALSKKQKGSCNREKAKLRVARLHERIANRRSDFTHKLSTKLIRENDVVIVEDLNLKAMAQGLNFGRSVHNIGFGEFTRQLIYKADWYGKLVLKADKWFASSKTCSSCGNYQKDITLADRLFECRICKLKICRDHNAAINLKNYGLKLLLGMGQPEITPLESATSDLSCGSGQVGSLN